ncbi:hypothetical protein [Spongorhabdus nitratireducens]
MKNVVKIINIALLLFFLAFSLSANSSAIKNRIDTMFRQWLLVLKTVDSMVVVFDLDETFYILNDPEMHLILDGENEQTGFTYFCSMFIAAIAKNPKVCVVYSTARPFGRQTDYIGIDTSESTALRSQVAAIGVDLDEREDVFVGSERRFEHTDDWLLLRQKPEKTGAKRPSVYIPAPHILVCGSGNYIQVGKKLKESGFDPAKYNDIVEQWVRQDIASMSEVTGFWRSFNLQIMPVTPSSYYRLGARRHNGSNWVNADIPDGLSGLSAYKTSSLAWFNSNKKGDVIAIQNMTINKGISLQWVLCEMRNIGILKESSKISISVLGDGEGDIPMICLKESGFSLMPLSQCDESKKSLISGRLACLGLGFDLPEWICDAWDCSMIPAKSALAGRFDKLSNDMGKIQVVPGEQAGLLPLMQETMRTLLSKHRGIPIQVE